MPGPIISPAGRDSHATGPRFSSVSARSSFATERDAVDTVVLGGVGHAKARFVGGKGGMTGAGAGCACARVCGAEVRA